MTKRFVGLALSLVWMASGCAVLSRSVAPPVESVQETSVPAAEPAEHVVLKVIPVKKDASAAESASGVVPEEEVKLGRIFAKSVFEGVVKSSYVQLSFYDLSDKEKTYSLIIGDKERLNSFPWKSQTVRPGYFFLELPPGRYRINSISIPVGSTKATEPIDIVFSVYEETETYLGTLKVTGTKERVRFGGIPVIRPGFEYKVSIRDDREEALKELTKRHKEDGGRVKIELMHYRPMLIGG